jgi:hypothetical protein
MIVAATPLSVLYALAHLADYPAERALEAMACAMEHT